jgi:hypothetical protein
MVFQHPFNTFIFAAEKYETRMKNWVQMKSFTGR